MLAALLLAATLGAASDVTAARRRARRPPAPPPAPPRVTMVRNLPVDPARIDVAAHVLPVTGGALIVGWTSIGQEPADALLLRVDEQGGVVWRRHVGGGGVDLAFSILPDRAGGFVCAGFTSSRGAGGTDGWIFAIDAQGDTAWQRTYGGAGNERLISLQADGDGWIAAGQTGVGIDVDAWVLRVDGRGRERSSWTWGGEGTQRALGLATLPSGEPVIVGGVGEGRAEVDAFVTRLNGLGRQVWTRPVDGPGYQVAYHLRRHTDGSLFVAGYGRMGESDDIGGYLLRLRGDGRVLRRTTLGADSTDRAVQSVVFDDGSAIVIGYSRPRAASDDQPVWTTMLYALDPRGTVTWLSPVGSPGRESGRWIAGTADNLWAVAQSATPSGGSAVMVVRLARR